MKASDTLIAWGDVHAPPLRGVLATLLSSADEADLAIAHVRLLAIDLSREESTALARCRMLLGRLDAAALGEIGGARTRDPPLHGSRDRDDEARIAFDDHDAPSPPTAAHFARLLRLIDTGRVSVRCGGAASWVPDFSVFRGLAASSGVPHGAICLVGAHYFTRPLPGAGAALTAVLTAPAAIRTASQRFDELWASGYDVEEAVRGVLEELVAP